MTSDRLVSYPWVIVRIGCNRCKRRGSYRLARLAAKFGPEITMDELLLRLSYDCPWRDGKRYKGQYINCGAFLPDLDRTVPPDLPPGVAAFRALRGGKA